MNIHEITFKRMRFSKVLWILSFNILFMQNLPAGDIEQILPADSNFTIDGDGAAEVMRVQSDGKVGIGTTTPNERLEVNGSIRMTDGNEAADTVMVGDANGTASWADISTVQDGTGTDDQNLQDFNLTGTTLKLTIENGNTVYVDLTSLSGTGTDDQQLQGFTLNGTDLNLTLEDGGTVTVDLSDLNDSAAIAAVQSALQAHITADEDTNATNEIQDISTDGTAGNIALSNGSTLTLNVNDADANSTNELLAGGTLNGTNLELTDAGGTTTIDLSALNNSGTDDQIISSAVEVANKSVKVTLEDGGNTVINIQDDDHNSTNEIQTLTSTDGTVVLTQTNNNYDLSVVPVPYIKDTSIIVPVSTTKTIMLNGYNFIPTSTVTIPGFDGTINSVQAVSPLQIELNITTGNINTFDLVVSNNGVLNTQWPGNGTGVLHVVDHSGQTKAAAGESCKHILDDGFSTGDGTYWINPDGGSTDNAFQVYCDMTTDGGGWTRIEYASDFAHEQHFSGGDSDQWLDTNFTLTLTDTQINAIRAVSTEGKQHYHGTCEGVIHHNYSGGNYSYAFGFRYHTGFETAYDQQTYPNTNITVTDDNCSANDNVLRSTDFDIVDTRVPVINVHSRDNGNDGEKFGSPLTNYPAWLR